MDAESPRAGILDLKDSINSSFCYYENISISQEGCKISYIEKLRAVARSSYKKSEKDIF